METRETYPVNLTIDCPDWVQNKLTTFLRPLTVIPIGLVLVLLGGVQGSKFPLAGWVVLPNALMLLFKRKYPKWWFDWNLAFTNFGLRVAAYVCLLTDAYPATDDDQAVHIHLPYPNAKENLNRWLPLVKWLLAIPHYIILAFLYFAVVVVVVVSWFMILFSGRISQDLFAFVVGVLRWSLRVLAYAFLLTTDQYPPFRLTE